MSVTSDQSQFVLRKRQLAYFIVVFCSSAFAYSSCVVNDCRYLGLYVSAGGHVQSTAFDNLDLDELRINVSNVKGCIAFDYNATARLALLTAVDHYPSSVLSQVSTFVATGLFGKQFMTNVVL